MSRKLRTDHQATVLRLVATGHTNLEITRIVGMNGKHCVEMLLREFGVRDRASLVAEAFRLRRLNWDASGQLEVWMTDTRTITLASK